MSTGLTLLSAIEVDVVPGPAATAQLGTATVIYYTETLMNQTLIDGSFGPKRYEMSGVAAGKRLSPTAYVVSRSRFRRGSARPQGFSQKPCLVSARR